MNISNALKTIRNTGIGSLPFTKVDDAFDYSFAHDLPFYPQLLPLEGDMLQQMQEGSSLQENFPLLDQFLEIAQKKNIQSVKIQIVGPCTLSKYAATLDFTYYKELLLKLISHVLRKKINPIIFFDEPFIKTSEVLLHFLKLLRTLNIKSGIHSCQRFDLVLLRYYRPDYFSFDSQLMLQTLLTDKKHLAYIQTTNIIIILGFNPRDLNQQWAQAKHFFSTSSHQSLVKNLFHHQQLMISSHCGIPNLSEPKAWILLKSLQNLT